MLLTTTDESTTLLLNAVRSDATASTRLRACSPEHAKHPDARLEQVGLQELTFEGEFDAVMCIDAMEHAPPEEWPLVLANLHRAVRPGGLLYLTVEETDEAEHAACSRGLPAVRGEYVGPDTGGYHHYPDRGQVRAWFDAEGLEIEDEADEGLDGYGYFHLLVR